MICRSSTLVALCFSFHTTITNSTGNKIRKLEFLLADALQKGCDSVVTIGGEQSNHCRATAAAARMVGLSKLFWTKY